MGLNIKVDLLLPKHSLDAKEVLLNCLKPLELKTIDLH